MAPRKRYSIYPTPALDRALADRAPHGEPDNSLRGRSATITCMCDRYAEIVRRSTPTFALNEWLLLFESLNGVWMQEHPAMTAAAVAHEVADNCRLNAAHQRFGVGANDWPELVSRIDALPFAGKIAVIDAAERFWIADIKTDDAESESDPLAHWRAPIRGLVGPLADDRDIGA